MFAELIFVALAVSGLFIIDSFSTSLAVVICGLLVYCYMYCFSYSLNKPLIFAFVISKSWGGLAHSFRVVKKMLCFTKSLFFCEKSAVDIPSNLTNIQFCGEIASLELEINIIVLKISQFYLHSWYDKISDDEEFLSYLNCCIKDTLMSLRKSLSKINKKKLSFEIMHIYLHFFTHFVDAKKKSEKFRSENFQMRHWALRDSLTEWCYLQSLVSAVIDTFGPAEYHNSFHSKHNPVLHSVVVEILTENVIYPLLNVLSDPTRLNSWILKLLINYAVKKEEPEAPVNGHSSKNSALNPEGFHGIKPKILLPAEDSFVKYVAEKKIFDVSHNTLSVPSETYASSETQHDESSSGKLRDVGTFKDLPSLAASGIKSTSNINLLNSEFGNTKSFSESSSSASCDISTIKRSKSADYIRQMPQLRALNVREYNITLQSGGNKILVALRSDANSNNLVEQAEEAVEIEVPTLFTDVRITDTQQQSEAGLLPYTLYCIQYSGVFHDTSSETPHFVKQVVSVKRRFREFLALQSRLDDNQLLRICLKGIKGPSKWLALPFSNLDKKNIAERKAFLESYLKELCSQAPITQSSELQEFLAYGGDARIAFVKKAADMGVPRIDKMLVRGVKGAIDMFRTALPNSPVEGGCSDLMPSKTVYEDASPDHRFPEHLLEFSSREPEIKENVSKFLRFFLQKSFCQSLSNCVKNSSSNVKRPSLLRHRCSLNVDESCMCSGTVNVKDEFLLEENPFGDVVIELLMEAVKINNVNITCFLSVIKLLGASCINRYFVNHIDSISEEQFAYSLHMLHKILWPDENSQEETIHQSDNSSQTRKIMECVEMLLAKNYITRNMSYTVRKFLLEKIYLFLSSIQHQQSNRCLLFHVFDVVIETLCSREE